VYFYEVGRISADVEAYNDVAVVCKKIPGIAVQF